MPQPNATGIQRTRLSFWSASVFSIISFTPGIWHLLYAIKTGPYRKNRAFAMTVVTRFPPSPTGFMHIGTARVALYNWLYARRHGGEMLFRIEDTDRARHSEEAVVALINGLKWLEMDYDGEMVSQFSRTSRHAEVANELLKKGEAYHCYCSPQELE